MSNIPPSMAAQPTVEVVPITTMISNTLVKDKAFLFNAIIAGLLIGYYLICKSSLNLQSRSFATADAK
jgi:fructose-specific phosphotransferase system IIC component